MCAGMGDLKVVEHQPLSLSLTLLYPPVLPPLLPPFPRQAKLAFERLEVEKEYHPFIQGPNGSTTKSIMEQTGARINIPPPSLMKNEITVAGDKDGVAKAVAQIRKIHDNVVRYIQSS